MSDDRQDMAIEVPVVAVNAGPSVLSDLLEADETLAQDILYLVGGIEHYRNFKHVTPRQFSLSLEDGGKDSSYLVTLLDTLIRFLIRMVEDIGNGSTGISLTLHKIINRAEAINTDSRSVRRVNKQTEFKIDTRVQNLCVNFKPINDPQKIMMYLKSADTVMRKYYKFQDEELLKVVPTITTLRPGTTASLDQLVSILSNVSPMSFASLAGFSSGEFRRSGPHLLGNQQLSVINKNPTGSLIEQLTGQEFLLQLSDAEPKPPPEFIMFDTFARTIEQSILRQVISTATDLANRISVMSRLRRTGRINDLVKYLDNLRRDISTGQYEGEALQNAVTFVMLLEAFNNWLVNPYLSLLALLSRNMSAILNVCEANN